MSKYNRKNINIIELGTIKRKENKKNKINWIEVMSLKRISYMAMSYTLLYNYYIFLNSPP